MSLDISVNNEDDAEASTMLVSIIRAGNVTGVKRKPGLSIYPSTPSLSEITVEYRTARAVRVCSSVFLATSRLMGVRFNASKGNFERSQIESRGGVAFNIPPPSRPFEDPIPLRSRAIGE
jgi:hypothetical protein